jgi:uncharacterized protein YndB with AHSA1/START domain
MSVTEVYFAIVRVLPAPPEVVFHAWTDPGQAAGWLDEEIVPRELDPPRRLVFTTPGSLLIVTLADGGGSTTMTFEASAPGDRAGEIEDAWWAAFDRLEARLG